MDRIIEILRRMSIRRRLVYAFLILFVIPVTSMIVMSTIFDYYYAKDTMESHHKQFAYGSTLRVNERFELFELKFDYLIENNDILADLYLYDTSEAYRSLAVTSRIENTIASIMSPIKEIIYTAIYLENESDFSYSRVPIDIAGLDELLFNEGRWHFFEVNQHPMLIMTENIEIDYNSGTHARFIAVISLDEVHPLLKEAVGSQKQQVAIVDAADQIIVGEVIESASLGYQEVIPLTSTGLWLKHTFPKEPYVWHSLHVALIIYVVALAMGAFILYLLNESIRIPLSRLLERIEKISKNETITVGPKELRTNSIDEHMILIDKFDQMLIRLNQLLDESYVSKIREAELRTRIKELELGSLQQRINPHFFYNLLDNVFWMTQMRGFEEIGEMISALGDFFKTSVSEKGAFVPIRTEIDNVKSYVYLQQMMHKGQFEAHWEIDPELLHFKTVKLILQPIIENCIVHGFEEIRSGGCIHIIGRRTGDDIVFEIRDNGKGIESAACERIRQKMNSNQLSVEGSIGMRNVNQRMKIYYGDLYGIEINSAIHEGTTVSLRIPIVDEMDVNESER